MALDRARAALFDSGIDVATVTETLQGSLALKMRGWRKGKINRFRKDLQKLFIGLEDEVREMGLSHAL